MLEPADAILARSLFCSPNDSFRPFFHRSHLFTPISKESPVFVMDVISQEAGTQLKVHTTCYDLTYRFNYESDWIAIIHRTVKKVALLPASPQSDAVEEGAGKIVRIFFTLADCNVDYQSSSHFSTPSRTILRLGDVRLSSNLVFPLASVQAISVGFGDLSMYLCSTRFGYEVRIVAETPLYVLTPPVRGLLHYCCKKEASYRKTKSVGGGCIGQNELPVSLDLG